MSISIPLDFDSAGFIGPGCFCRGPYPSCHPGIKHVAAGGRRSRHDPANQPLADHSRRTVDVHQPKRDGIGGCERPQCGPHGAAQSGDTRLRPALQVQRVNALQLDPATHAAPPPHLTRATNTRRLEHAWVSLENWTYSATFLINPHSPHDAALLAVGTVLQLDGVDTVADIWLNDRLVGSTNSAFVSWRLPVPQSVLVPGVNTLRVALQAPRAYASALAASYPYQVPLTNYYNVWSEPSHKNFIRKPPSDFGWDWGPSFMPTGLTGEVPTAGSHCTGPHCIRSHCIGSHCTGSGAYLRHGNLQTDARGKLTHEGYSTLKGPSTVYYLWILDTEPHTTHYTTRRLHSFQLFVRFHVTSCEWVISGW